MATRSPRRVVPGAVYEVMDRTAHGMHWFVPELRHAIEAGLNRAAKVTRTDLFGYVFMSNHYHLLLRARGPRQLSKFLQLLHTDVALAVNEHFARSGKVWIRRAHITPVSHEPQARVRRLAYLIANGVKEGAVDHPAAWQGPHFAKLFYDAAPPADAVASDSPDQSPMSSEVPQRPPSPGVLPLPHLASLPTEQWQLEMRRLIACIAASPKNREAGLEPHLFDAALPRPEVATPPVIAPAMETAGKTFDARQVRATQPPKGKKKHDPDPVHAFAVEVLMAMKAELHAFRGAYREASNRFLAGDRKVKFPAFCVLPPAAWLPSDDEEEGLFGSAGGFAMA